MEEPLSTKEFLESLLSNLTYYLVNETSKTYAWFRVTKTKYLYKVFSKRDIPFVTNPLEYDQLESKAIKCLDKEKLYDGLTKVLEAFLADNYVLVGNQEVFTQFLVGSIDDDFESILPEIKWSCQVSLPGGKNIRYDAFLDKLSVSKVHIKDDSLKDEFLYKLWFKNPLQVKVAMEAALDTYDEADKKYFADFNELKTYVESFKNISQIEIPEIEEILFEHIVEINPDEISELALPIPNTAFKSFNKNDMEEGRIYFWAKKGKGELKASTPIQIFILQNRSRGYFHLSEMMLGEFNQAYQDTWTLTYDTDDIDILLQEVKPKSWVEVAQEEVIEFFTKVEASEVLAQKNTSSIYYDNNVLDIYDNMIVQWAWEDSNSDKLYKTFFFDDEEKKQNFLKGIVAILKSYEFNPQPRKNLLEVIEYFGNVQIINKLYQEQRPLKEQFLQEHPEVLAKIEKASSKKNFLKYSPLWVIEGDHIVDGDWRVDADKESVIIYGDLVVSGTLFFETKEPFGSDHFLIVLGEVKAKNYVVNHAFSPTIFMKNLLVDGITYLLSGSANWVIHVGDELRTKTLIHSQDKIKDKQIFFEQDFSTKDDGVVQDWVKEERDSSKIFEAIVKGESLILNEKKDPETLEKERLLRSFESSLNHWHSLYYDFAGFELVELPIGQHYGHHIESDEIVKDVRHDTGLYLMNHETWGLEQVKEENPLRKNIISSVQLAYRYFWIMWTFSDWKHRDDGPLSYWEVPSKIDEAFENDQDFFSDPYLALYWLMHFGLLEDERYATVMDQVKDMDNEYIQGAILFFERLKVNKNFTIKIDYKEDNTLFKSRLASHQLEIQKANLPQEGAILLILEQFKLQPNNIPNILSELSQTEAWDIIKKYLANHPYEIGMSYLHILVSDDKKKWQDKFIQEAWAHGKEWKDNYLLLSFIEKIFEDLSFHNREQALSIIMNTNNLHNDARRRFTKLIEWHKVNTTEDKSEVDQQMKDYVATVDKEKFDFQDFMDRTNALSPDGKIKFIEYCLEADLFSNKCGKGPICHYLVLYWIEELFMGSKKEKLAMGRLVVDRYSLTRTHYQSNESLQDSPKSEREAMFKVIKKYLK